MPLTADADAMKVIVCLDDKGGMLFNNRRQSRDRVLNADVIDMARGSRLCIEPYSKLLFEDSAAEVLCDADFLNLAKDGDYCFVENRALTSYVDKIEEVVIYRWNRRYPTDVFFDLDLPKEGFKMSSSEDFVGYSHDKITKEVFRR